jgi:transposase
MPSSEDFRRRAVELHKSGESTTRELQELFGAAHTTVARWVRLEAATGGVKDLPSNRGRDPKIDAQRLVVVRELVDSSAHLRCDRRRHRRCVTRC